MVEDTNEGIKDAYGAIKRVWEGNTGLPDREFQAFVIRQLLGESGNHIEQYNAMSSIQQTVVQENKKALKTIKRRENAEDDSDMIGPGKGENGDYSGMN